MAKKPLKISIDEDTLATIKSNVGNISKFVEAMFEEYIKYMELDVIDEELDKIEEEQKTLTFKAIALKKAKLNRMNNALSKYETKNAHWRKFQIFIKDNSRSLFYIETDKDCYGHEDLIERLDEFNITLSEAESIKTNISYAPTYKQVTIRQDWYQYLKFLKNQNNELKPEWEIELQGAINDGYFHE